MNANSNNNNESNNRSTKKKKKTKKTRKQTSIKQWCSNNQTQLERMNIRKEYRDLYEKTVKERVDLIDPNSGKFSQFLEKQEKLFEKVQEPSEAVMDITQSCRMSEIVKFEANKIANQNFTITIKEFINCIKKNYTDNDQLLLTDEIHHGTPILWSKFAKLQLFDFIKTAPNMICLNLTSIHNAWQLNEKEEKKLNKINQNYYKIYLIKKKQN